MWWNFFSFIVVLAVRRIRQLATIAIPSRIPATFVGSAGFFAAVLVGAVPDLSLPDPTTPFQPQAEALALSAGSTSVSPSPRSGGVLYSTNPDAEIKEFGRKLERLLQGHASTVGGAGRGTS